MKDTRMFAALIAALFYFAALSPSLSHWWTPTAVTTQCTDWSGLQLHLPTDLLPAPLSEESNTEQVFISEDGQVEVIVRRSALPAACRPVDLYQAALEQQWTQSDRVIDLLDKAVSATDYRLEWLVEESVLVEQVFFVGAELVTLEASGPVNARGLIEELARGWAVVEGAVRP